MPALTCKLKYGYLSISDFIKSTCLLSLTITDANRVNLDIQNLYNLYTNGG